MEIKTKKEIRKEVKQRRKETASEQIHSWSAKIQERFLNLLEYQECSTVLAYMDCKNEVETGMVLERCFRDKKTVAVPRVFGEIMKFYEIHSLNDLEDGYFGIREPKFETLKEITTGEALMILPGVAFDEERHRVGYGGGFYDRYLEQYPDLRKIAFAFEFQVYPLVPFESYDRKPEKIITEDRIIDNLKTGQV